MTHRASFVLSLCSALLIPLGARAQSPAPEVPPADVAPSAPSEAAPVPEAPVEEEKPAEAAPTEATPAPEAPVAEPVAPAVDPAVAAPVAADPFAPAAPAAQEPATPSAAAEPAAPVPVTADASLSAALADKAAATSAPNSDKDKEARCATLFAQGQTALAQAEGCASGEAPIYAGSQVSFTQLAAPGMRTLPDSDNGFYALNLYLAPRFRLTEKWALFADVTLGYEVTTPDDANQRNEVVSTDTRIQFSGVLGNVGGVTFTTGPRLIVPTSKPSWAADVYAGVGGSLGAVKNFKLLSGLAVSATGVVTHIFSGNLTREVREGDPGTCQGSNGTESIAVECSAGQSRVVQDQFRLAGSGSLNFNDEWSTGLSYVYGWNLVKPFDDSVEDQIVVDTIAGPTVVDDIDENPIPDSRWRRNGSLSLSVNYQPTPWLFATLSGSTSVCYDSASGGQSAFGGCAGGMKQSDWWLRNPLWNAFSSVSLQLTVPVDAFIDAVTGKGVNEQKTAKAKAKSKL